MKIQSKFMTGLVSRIVKKVLRIKLGCEVDIQLNEFRTTVIDDKTHVHLDLDADLTKEELMEDKRMNEIEEIEATEVDETQDSSNAGALLAGVIGGFIAYAVIGGAKKLRVIIEEKVAAKKLAEAAKTDKAEIDSADEDSEEN